jgi:histidinol-phosphate/aromatic aminotransferase/cobyric acid decarboxylase-like protein
LPTPTSSTTIRELEDLAILYRLVDEYQSRYGAAPYNISHWDPSGETLSTVLKALRLPQSPLVAPYIYPGHLGIQQDIVRRLGTFAAEQSCLVVPTGTNAILFATWWLKTLGCTHLLVVCPAYFPAFYAAEIMDLRCTKLYMRRENRSWLLPKDQILAAIRKTPLEIAIWITNPIYCTGKYFDTADVEFLKSLLDRRIAIVADECLCAVGHEVGPNLSDSDLFLGLYSPHKSVCLNAVKFAAMVFDVRYRQLFTDWADVFVGGLAASTHSAVLHFIGDNFSHFQHAFTDRINPVRTAVAQIVRDCGTSLDIDDGSIGHLITCYAPRIRGDAGDQPTFLREFISETGAVVIPGIRNHFSPELGFTFRLNLARACPQFYSALHRTVEYLSRR